MESGLAPAGERAVSWYQQRVDELGRGRQQQARAEALSRFPSEQPSLVDFFRVEDQMMSATLGADASQDGSPGTIRYFGDYEDLVEIAQGGMGVVYKARQVSLNRLVALKMIRAGELATADEVRRFYAEAEAAANLDHPNIVPLYEVGEHEGRHYFSMAYVAGYNLLELVRDNLLSPREAAEYVATIAGAIHFAHEQGVLHRDIKPSNVLLDKTGQVRITDFGLAKRIGSDADLTRQSQVLGTPEYMSPEQAQGHHDDLGPAADVYSLGALLYTLLTGRPPFRSENWMTTLKQVVERDPISPRDLNPEIDRDLETVTLKCLEKEPQRRYVSAQALADDLGRYLRGEAVRARPLTPRRTRLEMVQASPGHHVVGDGRDSQCDPLEWYRLAI